MTTNLSVFDDLESKGVYIHFSAEHYTNGSNLLFSIDFQKSEDRTSRVGTGWYNDNHEFGGVKTTMEAAVKIAQWYLDKPDRISLINSGYHDPAYIAYVKELHEFTETLVISE